MPVLDYPHITKLVGQPAHLERLPRIRVAQIAADHLGNGWSAEEIVRQYPHITPAEVHAALGYFFDHRDEIDAELAEELDSIELDASRTPSVLRSKILAARRTRVA